MGGFNLAHEFHVAEAAGIRFFANDVIAPNEAKLAPLVADIPAGVAQLSALVQKDDAVLGPIAAGVVNGLVSGYQAEVDAELTALAEQGIAGIPAIVQALNNVANKVAAS